MATKQQERRNETSNEERVVANGELSTVRERGENVRTLASWFSIGDWRTRATTEEWALA